MRKILILAWAVLAAGCSLGEETVAVDEIEYREIRIDQLSLYLLSSRLTADSVRGDTVYRHYEDTSGNVMVEYEVLLKPSRDLTSELPPHVVDSATGDVFFPAEREPKIFTCMTRTNGADLDYWGGDREDPKALFEWVYRPGDSALTQVVTLERADDISYPGYCEYKPDRGFYYHPSMSVGEIIIRY